MNDETVKLIEAIKKWPLVYSSTHPLFRNNLWQQEAWRHIEQELNINVTLLKSKWGYLKSAYRQHKQLQHSIANNSAPPKKKKAATWLWAPYLSFLDENPADEARDPLDETQSSSQQFAANHENGDYSATSDTHVSSPLTVETVKIISSHEPSSALVKNTKKRYRGRRRIHSDSKLGANEENKDDTPITSPHREETVNIEPTPEPSSALAKNKRYSERRRIDSDLKVHVKKENEEDTHISSPHREETVINEPIPESNSVFTENRYSGRRIMVKMERSPEPCPSALLETSNSEDRYRRKRRIESVSEVDQREENEENGTMQNIQKSSSTTRQDNSYNSEKVDVKCDAVDLFFLGYADTFKRLSRRKQMLVKFEISKTFLEAELTDISDS